MSWTVFVAVVVAVLGSSAAIAVVVGRSIARADQIEMAHRETHRYTGIEAGDVALALLTMPIGGSRNRQTEVPPFHSTSICAACGMAKTADPHNRCEAAGSDWTHDVAEDYCPDCAAVRTRTWGY